MDVQNSATKNGATPAGSTRGSAALSSRTSVRRRLVVGCTAAAVGVGSVLSAQAATPPAAPHDITVFPQRDFVSIAGYDEFADRAATVTVRRNGTTTSTAQGVIVAGDPSLEVNHPGGVCWTGVTPDIKPGDQVSLAIAGRAEVDTTTTLSAEVTSFRKVGTDQLVVDGTTGPDVNTAQMEQRIVAPALVNTDVGRRDLRAPGKDGPYSSTLTLGAGTFRATYTFLADADTSAAEVTQMRDLAAAGQMRALSWQADNVAADAREGMTISEFGEIGGPGFGGCPNGPQNSPPNAPATVTATPGDSSIDVSWSGATTIPDGAAVTGYLVSAISPTGVRTTLPRTAVDVRSATISGLVNGTAYTVEVRASSLPGPGEAGTAGPVTPTATPPAADTTAPTVSGSPTGAGVAVSANVVASFDEAVTGVNATSFTLSSASGAVAASVSPAGNARVFTLDPANALLPGTTYTARVAGSVQDLAGNPLAAATWSFTTAAAPVDTAAPNTSITAGPTAFTRNTTASLSFTSTEAGSTFECALDAGAFAACTSPRSVTVATDGSHTFRVRATDAARNTDATPATRSWTLDRANPVVGAPTWNVSSFRPLAPGTATVRTSTNEVAANVTVQIRRSGSATVVRTLTRTNVAAGPVSFAWNGRTGAGVVVPAGTYTAQVTVRDRAGNLTSPTARPSVRVVRP